MIEIAMPAWVARSALAIAPPFIVLALSLRAGSGVKVMRADDLAGLLWAVFSFAWIVAFITGLIVANHFGGS